MENKIKELEAEIRDLESENKRLESKIDDKDNEIDELQDDIFENEKEIDQLKQGFHLELIHANVRTQSVIEELFDNLDYIPIAELEKFINNYKK